MEIFLAALVLVGLCVFGLCFNIIFRKDGKFPETEIENNKEMRKRGIKCAKEEEIKLGGKKDENYPPPAWKGKYIKIKYITQLPTRSPSFAFFCNLPQYIREPYRRFLENKLRSKFDFLGCPVQIFLRQK